MKKEPANYAYWKTILEDEDKVQQFMARGSDRQKKELKQCFQYNEFMNNKSQKDLFSIEK